MKKTLKIQYTKKADKFLAKNPHALSKDTVDALIIKAIQKIYYHTDTNIDLKKMVSMSNHFRIRKGNIRIVFSAQDDETWIITIIEDIDYRGGIYK